MLNSNKIIAFAGITDSKRARSFYEGLLGLTYVSEDQFALVFDANGTMLRLAKLPELNPAKFTVLGWETGEIEKTVEALRGKGVKFERYDWMPKEGSPVWSAPGGDKVAWFKDPDGNVLSLSQHG
jgi:catechol 2,3-dioxygenase-like lactoylglutathione lyase family enzyme